MSERHFHLTMRRLALKPSAIRKRGSRRRRAAARRLPPLACARCPPPATLRRTPLYDRHVAAGAKLVDFAGWEMPVQYEGVRTRSTWPCARRAGIFDVSHMGEIETSGPQALELLQRLLSNDVARSRRAARSTASSAARTAACSTTCSPTASTPTAT